MNLKEKLVNVFNLLGLTQKAKDNSLTSEEWKSVVNRFKEEYKVTLQDAMAEDANQAPAISQEEITAAYNLVSGLLQTGEETTAATAEGEGTAEGEEAPAGEEAPEGEQAATVQTTEPTFADVMAKLGTLSKNYTNMAHRIAPDKPLVTTAALGLHGVNGPADRSKFLFGVESSFFSMENRWNQITANPAVASLSNPTEEQATAFHKDVVNYSLSLQKRYAYLHANNLLNDPTALAKGEYATNFEGVTSLPGGNQFVVLDRKSVV